MNREIKFRAWDKEILEWKYFTLEELTHERTKFHRELENWTEYTGLKDKNGKEIYEGDILAVRHGISDKPEWYSYAAYEASIDPRRGIELRCTKMLPPEEDNNQFPIHQTLSFNYRSLTESYRSQKYDQVAVADTYGENPTFGNRWKQNHYSEDIEIIGNRYENPSLLSSK